MRTSTTIGVLLVAVFSFFVSTAEAYYGNRPIAPAAHELDEAAEHLHYLMHDLSGYSHIADEAHNLARAARRFHRAVENGISCRQMKRDFRKLGQQYRNLANEFRQAHRVHHRRRVVHDFAAVVEAFDKLEYAVDGYACEYRPETHGYPSVW